MRFTVNWNRLIWLTKEVLKALFTIYIINLLADPASGAEEKLTLFIGFMWYRLFVKSDYGEKSDEKK